MNFRELYNKVFIEENQDAEIANPDDFDDVQPLPVPSPEAEIGSEQPSAVIPAANNGTSTLTDYINQIEDFANKLNGTDGGSLQSLVSQLDKVESPFEGIYARTSAEIVDAAKTLRSVSEKLKNFIIHAAKK